ncbi:MAG: alpha-amylase family glycosyl hydrolase [Bacteroidota bacterium]
MTFLNVLRNVVWVFILIGITTPLFTQNVMMQGWYWDYPKDGCSGFDGDNWAVALNNKVGELKSAGINMLWLPPFTRASFGRCSNGYDPKDLYDLGEYGLGPTGFGTRAEVDVLVSACNANGILPIADVVYNHRDGGSPETNPAVKDYITTHYSTGKGPFPSDRYRCVLPIGPGTSIAGPGDYYLKISSKTGNFAGSGYKVYVTTNLKESDAYGGSISETEPNGGCDCGCEGSNVLPLNTDLVASIDDPNSGCGTDEIQVTLTASDFNATGDQLVIYLNNTGGYTDHRIYGIFYDDGTSGRNLDMNTEFFYETYTDFNNLPSGQGGMNFENFKPNSNNASSTFLNGDGDAMLFFYDVDQFQASTQSIYNAWSSWLWNDVGIRGYRMDAVKHFPPQFVGDLMNYLVGQGITPGMVVGEHFTVSAGVLKGWVDQVENAMSASTKQVVNMRAFDFELRAALEAACDAFGYDVRNVFNSGMVDAAGASGFQSVTFVNNHDYRGSNELVDNDPILAYAYILLNNQVGLPCVFYPDYYGVTLPNHNAPPANLSAEINQLISIQNQHIAGASKRDYLSRFGTPYTQNFTSGGASTTLFFQLSRGAGGKDVLVAINFAGESLEMAHTVNTGLDFSLSPGSELTELTGNSTTSLLTVDGGSFVNFQVPARSYAVWVESNNIVLPVELLAFNAKADGNTVNLSWESAAEPDLAGYELQRSTDGKSFEKIDWVTARGSANSGDNYAYTDRLDRPKGVYYYRLKAIDDDGAFEYSPIQASSFTATPEKLSIFPNPAKESVTITFEDAAESSATLQVINSTGEQLYAQAFSTIEGTNQLILETLAYPAGVYFIRIIAESGQSWTTRLVVNK